VRGREAQHARHAGPCHCHKYRRFGGWPEFVGPARVDLVAGLLIGLVTFTFSLAGTLLGCSIGKLVKDKAEILGGLVLIGIGIKILLQGLH
jgi:hypothetical protein